MELFHLGTDGTDYCLLLQEMISPLSVLDSSSIDCFYSTLNYRAAKTFGAQVFEASSSAEKKWVTTPSSAIKENLLVRTITGDSISNPNALLNSALASERKRMPASAPPDVLPHAYNLTSHSRTIITGQISIRHKRYIKKDFLTNLHHESIISSDTDGQLNTLSLQLFLGCNERRQVRFAAARGESSRDGKDSNFLSGNKLSNVDSLWSPVVSLSLLESNSRNSISDFHFAGHVKSCG